MWISTLLPHVCFPRGRCRELLECHRVPSKRSYAVFVRATVLHVCHVGNYNGLGCVRKGSSPRLRGHLLTHWGRDKMAAIYQTTFSNAFPWMKMYEIWLKVHWSVRKGSINNVATLVLIMAWRRPGDKPLSGPMMVRWPTHICVTRPQWVKDNHIKRKPCRSTHLEAEEFSLSCLESGWTW